MSKMILRPYPDSVYPGGPYLYDKAVPVNIYINGQKVEAPKAGIKVGRPMLPDIMPDGVAIKLGDYIDDN